MIKYWYFKFKRRTSGSWMYDDIYGEECFFHSQLAKYMKQNPSHIYLPCSAKEADDMANVDSEEVFDNDDEDDRYSDGDF